jgi:peptidyl-prolyl cis-trans isomerase D
MATVKENDRTVPGLEQSRTLVRAAFTGDINNMLVNNEGSTIFEFGDKFVVGLLTKAAEEGNSSFEDAKTSIELAVKKEKKAKILAEKLKNAAAGQSDMEAIASKLSTPVKQASGVNFSSYSIPSVGFEPAVIGAVCNLPSGKVSAPIEGLNGVYLAKVTDFTTNSNTDLKGEKMRLAQSLGYRAGAQIFESLKKGVEIEDKRSKFY